jgi:putative ABC transport system permease protein
MRRLLRRLTYFVRRGRRDAELREEMDFHREMLAHRSLGGGGFGNATLAREDARAVWTRGTLERLVQDVRYGARSLWKGRGFSMTAVATLALGIGGSAVMFSVVNGVLLRPLPYGDPERVAMLWTIDAARGLREGGTSYPTFTDWRTQSHSFADMAIWRGVAGNLTGTESPERLSGALVSPNLFPLLGVPARLGRTFTPDDEARRAEIVILSHRLWQRRFGGSREAIGKPLEIDGRVFEIVGVMPDGFFFPTKDVQYWQPSRLHGLSMPKRVLAERSWSQRYNDLWHVVGRLRPGVSVRDAQAEMSAIGRRLAVTYPSPSPDFIGFDVEVVPMLLQITGRDLQLALWVLLGAVGFVLLIACANVTNLLLARGVTREREFAMRAALGAGRGRLLRQLAIENTLLALAAGAAGVAIAAGGIRVLTSAATPGIPRLEEIVLDGRVLAFTAIVSLLASILFGTAPAWRLSSGNAADSLRQTGAATAGVAARRMRGLLVVAECALAVMLLAGAGLLIRSLASVQSVSPGFDPSRVLLVRVHLPLPYLPQVADMQRWRRQEWATFQQMENRIAQIPGVTRVGMIQNYLNPASPEEAITIENAAAPVGDTLVTVTDTTPGFFQAMGVPLAAGRLFTQQDLNGPTTIVNQAFVKRFFGNGDPIGKRFTEGMPGGKSVWHMIVGVVGDMRRNGLERDPLPEYYFCSSEPTMDVVVRANGNLAPLAPAVREAIRSVYAQSVILSSATAEATLGDLSAQRRFQTWLLTVFAGVALLLAAIGTYGIVHFAVAQRTQEIGVRMALGAGRGDIVRMILSQGMVLPFAGTLIGLLGALSLTRVMRHLLFRVDPADPATFATVAAVLVAVALPACWMPSRRAMRVDPLVALRHE